MGRCLPIFALALLVSPRAAAQTDYLPDNSQWAGLSELASIAHGAQIPLQLAAELDWATLGPKDALLILYPRKALDPRSALAFLDEGGRLLIADDFGSGAPLLGALKIERREEAPRTTFHYQDNANLPIAINRQGPHPLLRGVRAVVTNHPASFRSPYPTLLGFGPEQPSVQQLMVAGPRGKGRFVALADPSILINVMLRFDGNLRLAKNLVKHLCHDGCAKIVLVTGYFRERVDVAHAAGAQPATAKRINTIVGRVNDFALTETGMRVLAFIAGGMALAALLLVLPLPRQDLDGRWLRPSTRPQQYDELRLAAQTLREEIEQTLGEALRAPGPLSTLQSNWIIARCVERGGAEGGRSCAKLLSALAKLPYSSERRGSMRRLRDKDLEAVYRQSRGLFALLDGKRSTTGEK